MKNLEDLNIKRALIYKLKNENPDLKLGFSYNIGSVLNAYRECDITFSEAVDIISKIKRI